MYPTSRITAPALTTYFTTEWLEAIFPTLNHSSVPEASWSLVYLNQKPFFYSYWMKQHLKAEMFPHLMILLLSNQQ